MSEVTASDLCALISLSNFFAILRPFHPPRKNLASAPARAPAFQKIACILFQQFWQSPSPSTHPVKIRQALPRWHLRIKKLHTFYFQNFGNPRAFPPPPRKNLASATARLPRGPLRVRKLRTFFLQFLQSFGPSTHPIKVSRALPRGHLRVRKLHTFYFQLFCNPPTFHPPSKNLASATARAPACQKIAYV